MVTRLLPILRGARGAAAVVLATLAAVLLIGAGTGVIRWDQINALFRHGTGSYGQSSDGTGAAGDCAKFDANGNITDAGAACGSGGSGAMTLISSQTLGSAAATVTFSSIPGTYSNLVLSYTARGDTAATSVGVALNFNGDTAADYNEQVGFINNTFNSAGNSSGNTAFGPLGVPAATATSKYAGTNKVEIYNYANTTFFKNVLGLQTLFANTTLGSGQFEESAGQWLSTAAISSISIKPTSGNFIAGSTFQLYGLQ